MIKFEIIEKLEKQLKMNIGVELRESEMILKCDNKCRLLSHLIHRTGLDIHCTNQGVFTINYEEYTIKELIGSFQMILDNPVWIIEFIEKYLDNEFMMNSTFKPIEVEE